MNAVVSHFRNLAITVLGFAGLMLALLGGSARAQEPGTTDLSPQLEEVFSQGVRALEAGQLDRAEKAFLKVLQGGGRTAFVYNNLGIVYQQRGEYERAIAQFREAIRLQPDYVAPHALIGSTLLATGKYAEARRELATAVKLQPRDPLARLQLAKAYRREENMLEVVDQFQKLRELSPQDPEYVYQSGRAYLDLSAWCYQRIVGLNPGSARAYQTLGENFRAQGRPELALRAFQQAAQIDPTLPEVHLALAEIYTKQEKTSEALKEVEKELALVPESAAALALKNKLETR